MLSYINIEDHIHGFKYADFIRTDKVCFFLVFCGYTALNILCARHYSRLFFLLIPKLICVRADEVCLSVWNHHIKNGKFRIG